MYLSHFKAGEILSKEFLSKISYCVVLEGSLELIGLKKSNSEKNENLEFSFNNCKPGASKGHTEEVILAEKSAEESTGCDPNFKPLKSYIGEIFSSKEKKRPKINSNTNQSSNEQSSSWQLQLNQPNKSNSLQKAKNPSFSNTVDSSISIEEGDIDQTPSRLNRVLEKGKTKQN